MASISAMAPLRYRNFRWYVASRSINLIGNMMAPVALAFAVFEVTDSAAALGVVLAARTIPLVVFLLLGGVIADRWGRNRVIYGSNMLAGLTQLVLAVLFLAGVADFWHLVVISALNGVVSAAALPAINGLVPQLVPHEQLQAANSLTSLVRAAVAVLGPSIAAGLVAGLGPGWALFGVSGTWFASALLMMPVRLPREQASERPSFLSELRVGWNFVSSTTWLWQLVLAFTVLNLLYEGGFIALGPLRAERSDLGPGGWGLLLSVQGIGVLLATLVFLRWRLRRPLVLGMIGSALFGLPILMIGLTTSLPWLLPAAVLSGIGIQTYSLGWQLALQENVPEELLSRAISYDQLGSFAAIPIGQLALGPLAETVGLNEVLIVAGSLYIVLSLVTLLSPSIRNLSRRVEPAPSLTRSPSR